MADDPKAAPATSPATQIQNVAQVRSDSTESRPGVASKPPVTGAAKPMEASRMAKIATGSDTIPTNFSGYPKTKYHPVHGAVIANDPNEEAAFIPAHDFFDSPGAADMARTDREAQQVIMHNLAIKVGAKLDGRPVDLTNPAETGGAGVVRNSVQATENLKTTGVEPL